MIVLAREDFDRYVQERKDTRKNNGTVSKSRVAYMAQPNVKEFNKEMQKKIFTKSRVNAFSKYEDLEKEISDFFEICSRTDTVPTVTSLALWLGCNRDTIYAHANNSNSPYSDVMKRTINYMHSVMENGTVDGKINPVTYIFLSKNYYGMRDDKNITVTPTGPSQDTNSPETIDAIRKQIEEENIPNAEFSEK